MEWHSPTGPLVHEHRVIERMIALMRDQLGAIASSGRADPVFVDIATDFIRSYADRCHHGKEEDILFRELANKDMTAEDQQAMAELIQDHVHGRELTGMLVDANSRYAHGDTEALTEITQAMQELVDFYPVHIDKEDHQFFRACLRYLSDDEQTRMIREYGTFDAGLVHEKYRGIVERLEEASASNREGATPSE